MKTGILGKAAALAIAGATAISAGCATAPERDQARLAGDERQCFLPRTVSGFHAVDGNTVHVTAGVDTVYELEIVGACPDVDWSLQIGIRSTGGSSWVCRGFDAELLVPGPLGVQQCPVTMVRRLSEEEARALRGSSD